MSQHAKHVYSLLDSRQHELQAFAFRVVGGQREAGQSLLPSEDARIGAMQKQIDELAETVRQLIAANSTKMFNRGAFLFKRLS